MKKEATKAPHTAAAPPESLTRVTLMGVDYTTDQRGNLQLLLPSVPLPELDQPLLSEEARQWSIDNGIPESVYGAAYEAAREAFMDDLQRGLVIESLKSYMLIATKEDNRHE